MRTVIHSPDRLRVLILVILLISFFHTASAQIDAMKKITASANGTVGLAVSGPTEADTVTINGSVHFPTRIRR